MEAILEKVLWKSMCTKKTITACLMVGKPHEESPKNGKNVYHHDPGPFGLPRTG